MHEPTTPPAFDPRDWAQFDFSRWHLDGLPVEAVPAAVADLAQRLFGSDEWRQRFQISLPAVQRGVLDAYREHARQLEEEKAAAARDFDQRIGDAQTRSEEFGQGIAAEGSPPAVEPDPQTYLLGVRVTASAEAHLGLPGLVVQVIGPRDKTALAQSLTDRDGNALLAIPAAKASASAKRDATLENPHRGRRVAATAARRGVRPSQPGGDKSGRPPGFCGGRSAQERRARAEVPARSPGPRAGHEDRPPPPGARRSLAVSRPAAARRPRDHRPARGAGFQPTSGRCSEGPDGARRGTPRPADGTAGRSGAAKQSPAGLVRHGHRGFFPGLFGRAGAFGHGRQ